MSGSFDEFESADPGFTIRTMLESAIQIGAPVYNCGDERGCYDIYAATARMLLQVVRDADVELGILREALQEASIEPTVHEQSWILRRAFDRILGEDVDEEFDNRN